MENISLEDFDLLLEGDQLVVIDFFAEWCGPCKMMKPIIEELIEENKDNDKIKILTIDVDQRPEISSRYDIMSIPSFLFIKNGDVLFQQAGATTKDFFIEKIKEFSK